MCPLTTENLVSSNNADFFNKVIIVREWNKNVCWNAFFSLYLPAYYL